MRIYSSFLIFVFVVIVVNSQAVLSSDDSNGQLMVDSSAFEEIGNDVKLMSPGIVQLVLANGLLDVHIDYPNCYGDVLFCYQSAASSTEDVEKVCQPGFCGFKISTTPDKLFFVDNNKFLRTGFNNCDTVTRMKDGEALYCGKPVASCDPAVDKDNIIMFNVIQASASCPITILNAKIYVPLVPSTTTSSSSSIFLSSSEASTTNGSIILIVCVVVAVVTILIIITVALLIISIIVAAVVIDFIIIIAMLSICVIGSVVVILIIIFIVDAVVCYKKRSNKEKQALIQVLEKVVISKPVKAANELKEKTKVEPEEKEVKPIKVEERKNFGAPHPKAAKENPKKVPDEIKPPESLPKKESIDVIVEPFPAPIIEDEAPKKFKHRQPWENLIRATSGSSGSRMRGRFKDSVESQRSLNKNTAYEAHYKSMERSGLIGKKMIESLAKRKAIEQLKEYGLTLDKDGKAMKLSKTTRTFLQQPDTPEYIRFTCFALEFGHSFPVDEEHLQKYSMALLLVDGFSLNNTDETQRHSLEIFRRELPFWRRNSIIEERNAFGYPANAIEAANEMNPDFFNDVKRINTNSTPNDSEEKRSNSKSNDPSKEATATESN